MSWLLGKKTCPGRQAGCYRHISSHLYSAPCRDVQPLLLSMFSWLMSSFYHLCLVCIGVGVRGASCWWEKAGIPHGLKRFSNSNAKTLLCSVGFCYEYLTHPSIDVWFRRIYPLLELKNHTCSCVLLRLVDCFIKIAHTYSSGKMEVERRHTSPFQPSIYSSLQPKWLLEREISQISRPKTTKGNTNLCAVQPVFNRKYGYITCTWASCEPCSHSLAPKVWTTASSSTSKPLREKKLAATSCCGSPTRSWRTWECPGSAIRSSYWRLWTYSVLWWVLGPHPAFPFQSSPSPLKSPPPKSVMFVT